MRICFRSPLAITAVVCAGACSNASGPESRTGDVVYVLGETHNVFAVDPRSGAILASPGPVPELLISPVMSSDSSALYFTGLDGDRSAIYVLHAGSFTVEPFYMLRFPPNVPAESVWVMGGALAVAPGRGELYDGSGGVGTLEVGDTTRSGRLAVFDTATRTVERSFAPFNAGGLTALPAGPVATAGALVGFTFIGYDEASLCSILVLDPATGAVLDSAVVPRPSGGNRDFPRSMIASPDGERVYLFATRGIYAFDLISRRLLQFVPVDPDVYEVRLSLAPDASRVYLIENTSAALLSPDPSTTIRVFNRDLEEKTPITLTKQYGNSAQVLHDVMVSRDNRYLYLEAGNRDFFGQGVLRILVFDLHTGRVVRTVPLGVYGQGRMILGHTL